MKRTINQPTLWYHLLSLKLVVTVVLLTLFSPVFSQTNNPPGFDAGKERQEAVKKGIHPDEVDHYVEKMRRHYLRLDVTKNSGSTLTIPPKTIERKSGGADCFGTFENGNVAPWSGFTGTNTGINDCVKDMILYTPGIVAGQHSIFTPSTDPIVTTMNRVHSGNYGLRLGNSNIYGGTERIAKTVTVTGTCLSFWYALVFEDPNHPYDDQPFFMFRIKDNTGAVIHSYVREASNDPFFTKLGGGTIVYRDWTKYDVNLPCNLIGKDITIEFTTADCAQGGHYGYAYIDDVCMENCCNTCEKLFNNVNTMLNYNFIDYIGSTDSTCCYKFWWIFDPDLFRCSPFGVRIYNDSNPSEVFTDYLDTQGLMWTCRGSIFDASLLDFCVKRSEFTKAKKLRIEFLDHNGDVICDTLTKIIEPCHSTSSGCNCNTLFENANFAKTSIIKKDEAASTEYDCCFTLEPFRDSTIIKCPYYGIRIYKDTSTGSFSPHLDTFKTGTPMGGPGADMNDTSKIRFCIDNNLFVNYGPQTLRIEYLDSNGKVICSTTETVKCQPSCCQNVNINVISLTESDPMRCCISISGFLGSCFLARSIELMEYNGTDWVGTDTVPVPPTGVFYFDSLCRINGDTTRYMIFIKDSAGNILCMKEVIQTCPSCCDLVPYSATYVPPAPFADRCCWDINLYPQASPNCNVWNWMVVDSLQNVPPFWLTIPNSTIYQGRHCTNYIIPPLPAPGHTITIEYCITRYIAVYDNFGMLLCIKPFELCCTRTYTNPGPPQGPLELTVAPNPFNNEFMLSMDLPHEMPVAVNVINPTGTIVYTDSYGTQPAGPFTKTINLAGLPPGTYTLSVNNGLISTQIVKQ